jgi:hypothetical protein
MLFKTFNTWYSFKRDAFAEAIITLRNPISQIPVDCIDLLKDLKNVKVSVI